MCNNPQSNIFVPTIHNGISVQKTCETKYILGIVAPFSISSCLSGSLYLCKLLVSIDTSDCICHILKHRTPKVHLLETRLPSILGGLSLMRSKCLNSIRWQNTPDIAERYWVSNRKLTEIFYEPKGSPKFWRRNFSFSAKTFQDILW